MLDDSRLNTIALRVRAGLVLAADVRALLDEVYRQRELLRESRPEPLTPVPCPPTPVLSFREAVYRVLRAAKGPLLAKDIWLIVQEMGITTNAKDPVKNVELTCHGLRKKGITKTGPGTWQWTGEEADHA